MIKRLKKITAVILVVMTLCSIIIPSGITELFKREVEAYGAFTLGTSGSLSASQARSARSGIMSEAFREPPIRVSLYRNEKVSYDKSKEEILSEMSRGQPENLTGSMYFLTSYSVSDFRNRPVSIGEANVSSKSLTYYSTEDDLNNLIIMENNPNIGTVKSAKGVYYKLMNNNYDDFVDKWETYANDASYKGMSKQVWSYIFKQDSAHGYHVEDRINEIFNPDNYDKESENLTEEQTKELRYHYIDILMTLYSISSGRQKAEWKAAVNDYINVENLDESPISVCIDSAVVMVLYDLDSTGRLLILPTIDYLNYVAGVETQFAMNGVAWWGNKPVSSRHKGDSEAQLLDSVQESLNASPTFQRITDSVSQSNGFSWGLSALLSGRLSTANGVASIDYSSVEQEYFKIFKMDAAQGLPDKMYGYMLLIGTEAEVKTPDRADLKLKLIAQPDNKAVTDKVLGEAVKLDLWSDCEAKDISELKRLIDNNDDDTYILTIVWHRACPVLGYARSEVPSQIVETLSGSEFLRFIRGEYSISAVDDVASINVEAYKNKKIEFNYEAELTIQNSQAEYIIIKDSKTGDVVPSKDTASYVVQGEKIGYTSKPEAYSELKNYGAGSNTSGTLKESYEAMAGIPSTEQLYLAAGGSEFVVEVTVEYVENEVAKRTYHSHYDGTDCEFKAGDTAQNYTVPSPSGASSSSLTANVHSGGTVTATWTGTRKWTGSETHYDHGGSVVNTWDDSLYNAALQQANAWITSVNSHKIYHKAASDGVNRVFNGWNAKITVNSKLDGSPAWYKPGQPFVPPSYDEEGNMISAGQPYEPSSGAKGTDGSYTITVTATLPAHCICGPCCSHELPEINDTWAQTFEYDTMKISDVHVWTIDQAAVDGMKEITSVDVIGADIITGRPNIFYNIALKNDKNYVAQDGKGGATGSSLAGRIRYSYEPKQHDEVYLDNGTRTNKCDGLSKTYASNTTQAGGSGHTHAWATGFIYNNFKPSASTSGATGYAGHLNYPTNTANYLQNNTDAKDKSTTEYSKFLSQRNTTVTATMITDFLILQTSSGDQSVLYYHKDSQAVKSEVKIPAIDVTEKTMWDDNVNSAAKWEANEINVGGYNGNYTDVTNKFKGTGSNEKVATFVDVDPANKIVRPTRPSTRLMLYKGAINIILGNRNKSYMTGEAEVFWANSLHWTDTSSPYFAGVTNSPSIAVYPTGDKIGPNTGYNFGTLAHYIPEGPNTGGFTILAPYSKEHGKINNIIVHDPVSTEYAHTISLDESRDQRTGETLGSAEDIIGDLNELKVCPREPGLCDFRVLNCTYFQDTVLLDMDFDTVDSSNNPINKKTGNAFLLPNNFTLTTNSTLSSNRVLDAKGTRLGIPFSELGIDYRNPTHLLVEADILMSKQSTSSMIFSFYKYDVFVPANQQYIVINTGNGEELKVAKNIADGKKHHIAVDFSFNNAESCKVYVDGVQYNLERKNSSNQINSSLVGKYLYVGSWGYDNKYPAKFMIDNFKVTRLAGTNHHTEDCYRYVEVNIPGEGIHEHSAACINSKTEQVVDEQYTVPAGSQTFSYTGGMQIFTAPADGTYTFEVWGAEGGSKTDSPAYTGGLGGYAKGTATLTRGQTVYICVGQKGTSNGGNTGDVPAAYNGGGSTWHKSAGGGGATHISKVNAQLKSVSASNLIIAAGGGGGAGHTGRGGHGSGTDTGETGYYGSRQNLNGGGQANSRTPYEYTSGGVIRSGENSNGEEFGHGGGGGAGGGGYKWGRAGGYWMSSGGGGGSGYTAGLGSVETSTGTRSGNGQAKISWGTMQVKTYKTVYTEGGAEWVIQEYLAGRLTDQQLKDIVGEHIYNLIKDKLLGSVIYTWKNWTSSNMQGFAARKECSLTATGNNLVINSTGTDPKFEVPVDIASSGVTKVVVTMDNNTASTTAEMFWKTDKSTSYTEDKRVSVTIKANTANQVVTFRVSDIGTWKDVITGLNFDLTTASGTVTVKKIEVYGKGKLIGAGGAGDVVWQSGVASQHTVLLQPGIYKFETWGAQGGTYSSYIGGKGAYSVGTKEITSNTVVYVNVGGAGTYNDNGTSAGGYNGGGNGYTGSIETQNEDKGIIAEVNAASGGGSTDIRIGGTGVDNRVIVASGGAGGGYGKGTEMKRVTGVNPVTGQIGYWYVPVGTFESGISGKDGNIGAQTSTKIYGSSYGYKEGAGGGGYYGGASGSGGSSYIGGVVSYGGITAKTIAGNASMPNPSGGTMTGKSGGGYARITRVFSPVVIGRPEGDIYNFTPVTSLQSVVLKPGLYKFETWGAQGGNAGGYPGGKGAYSVGVKQITSTTEVYVAVGGAGKYSVNGEAAGGYNGGGGGFTGQIMQSNPPYASVIILHTASGGGSTDIRIGGTGVDNRVIVASGGAGGGYGNGSTMVGYPNGQVIDTWENSSSGGGGNIGTASDVKLTGADYGLGLGAGGGGYYGGTASSGGSSYIGGVVSYGGITAETIAGNGAMPNPSGGIMVGKAGGGYARITSLEAKDIPIAELAQIIKSNWALLNPKLPNGNDNPIFVCDPSDAGYYTSYGPSIVIEQYILSCNESHHKGMHYDISNKTCWQACFNDENHKHYKEEVNTTDGSFVPGNFINMDYEFEVYFPNRGDFNEGQSNGIGSLTSSKGLGFTNGMDTGRWTREKRIKFDFNVIYNNKLYNAGEWIVLGNKGSYTGTDGSAYSESKWSNYGTELYTDIYKDTYQFYCVLANYEAKAARIQVEIDAVNSYGVNDNKVSMSNRHRGTYASLHGGFKELYVDIVGRIGNLTVHDTGDYRFSNFFKKAADTKYFDLVEEYDAEIVNNAVDGVCMIQGEYRVDIRGVELTGGALSILDGLTEWESIRNYEVIKYTPNEVSVKFNVVDDSEMSGVRFEYISNYGQYPEVSGIDIRRIVNDESDWVVDGVVRVIDESKQNHYMAYKEDIRGIEISNSTNYINTYGTQKWAEEATHVILPISSDKNNIDLLRSEPIRIGYGIYYDISTIGNYFLDGECELQLVPYYYALNTVTKELTPVDAYFKYSGEYHAANIFDIVNSDWKGEGIYNYTINLDWDNEKVRRNYTDEEQSRTDFLRDYYATGFDVDTGEILDTGESYTGSVSFKQLDTPSGSNYALGNTQFLSLNGKARTFIGGDTTYGIPKNLGGKLQSHLWWQSAQRWHLNTKLPSSSVFVRHKGIEKDMHGNVVNRVLTDEEIEEFQNGNYVVLCAVNIVVVGNTYMLKYDHIGYNGQVGIRTVGSDGVEKYINVILPDDIPPVIAVYSSEKSSILDVEIVGTH